MAHARAGGDVITLESEKLNEYMTEQTRRREDLRLEKHKVVKKLKNRRRFGRVPLKENGDRRMHYSEKGFTKSRGNIAKGLVFKLNSINAATNSKMYEINGMVQPKSASDAANKFSFYDRHSTKHETVSAFQYIHGTSIYFGSEICLQARHGGYISYAHKENIRASAPVIFSGTRFIITNCDTPSDNGTLEYGKPCLLEVPGKSVNSGEVFIDAIISYN